LRCLGNANIQLAIASPKVSLVDAHFVGFASYVRIAKPRKNKTESTRTLIRVIARKHN